MRLGDIKEHVRHIHRKYSEQIVIHEGRLSWIGEPASKEEMNFIRDNKAEFLILVRMHESAVQFAKLWEMGHIKTAIEHAIMGGMPCYEDGIRDSSPIGWRRELVRMRGDK